MCAFRRPVARGSRAIILTRDHDKRNTLFPVPGGCFMDRQKFAVGHIASPPPFSTIRHLVTDTNIRKGASEHDIMVDSSCGEGVEVLLCHSQALQVTTRR